eukprot:scaffold187598_cov30-Tisochrysis_lutea.AAC.3
MVHLGLPTADARLMYAFKARFRAMRGVHFKLLSVAVFEILTYGYPEHLEHVNSASFSGLLKYRLRRLHPRSRGECCRGVTGSCIDTEAALRIGATFLVPKREDRLPISSTGWLVGTVHATKARFAPTADEQAVFRRVREGGGLGECWRASSHRDDCRGSECRGRACRYGHES